MGWGWWFALPKSPVKCFLVVQGFGEDDGVVDSQSSVEVISDLRVTEPDGTSRPATRSEQEELKAHLDLEREMDAEQAEGDAARYKEYYEGVLQEARHRLNVAQARAAREFDNATMEQAMQAGPDSKRVRLTYSVRDEQGTVMTSGSADMLIPPAARLSVFTSLQDADGPV